jgi:peroxiredoxin
MASVSTGLGTERSLAESRIERDGIKPGTLAPEFSLPSALQGTISLEDYRGRPVLLVFSDPQCGPCEELAPSLVRLAAEHSGLQVLMVSRGDVEANRAKALAFPFPVALQDGWQLSREYGIFATPVAFLIDEAGFVTRPVAIGFQPILALAATVPSKPLGTIATVTALAITRWRALSGMAAAVAGAVVMAPRRALAQTAPCPTSSVAGQVLCSGTCVDVASSPTNCGRCANACPSGICISGVCQGCPAGSIVCNGKCVAVTSDPSNCGACGSVCGPGSACNNGSCTCAAGSTNCGPTSGCVNLAGDTNNCGACAKKCQPGAVCSNGVCACPPGYVNCGSQGCVQGACTGLPLGSHCTSGTQCASGKCSVIGLCVS